MASSAITHRSGTPLGALADVPPHEREQEPYSVGPCPQMGKDVQVDVLSTHHGHDGPVAASAPGNVDGNPLTHCMAKQGSKLGIWVTSPVG